MTPNGSPSYTQAFGASDQDADGDLIDIEEPYRIFVLSIADGTNANVNAIAYSGIPVTLNTTTDIALSIVGSDIADNANGTDLQVDFDAAVLEVRVSEYRIIVVKSGTTYSLADAEAAATGSFITVAATGAASYSQVFTILNTDSDLDLIVEGQAYTIYVLSIADGTLSNLNNLTSSATDITLTNSIGIEENELDAITAYSNGEQFVIETPVEILERDLNVSIVSMNGAIVKKLAVKDTMTKIIHTEMKTGVYIIHFIDSLGNQTTTKIAL
ncbi:MAG: hypothetical protein HRU15_14865 [Planctomycetes bacterium]|nr:hypothetical protein [Planctomycetota bacterium]